MKKSIIIISILLLSLMVFTSQTFATSVPEDAKVNTPVATENNNPTLYEVQNEVMPISIDLEEDSYSQDYIEDDVYIASDKIVLEKSVNGNVYLCGDEINITSSMILGNVYVFGNTIKIDADITGSIYAAAKEITITGGAADAYIMTEKVNFEENSYISRNARVIGNVLNLKGSIERDLYSLSNETNILGTVFGGVRGKIYYSGNLNLEENTKVGETIKLEDKTEDIKENTSTFFEMLSQALNRLIVVTQIFTALVIIIIIGLFAKKYEEVSKVKRNYITDLIRGFLCLICIPIISIFLFITIIGMPLGIVMIVIYILALFLSLPMASIDVARMVLKEKLDKKWKLILAAIAVYLVLELVRLIPFIGGIIRFIFIIYGLNLILSFPFKKSKNKKEEQQVIVTTEE